MHVQQEPAAPWPEGRFSTEGSPARPVGSSAETTRALRGHRLAYDNILETIGSTPLVRLSSFLDRDDVDLWAKLEGANPGGSAKDRPAFRMLESARQRGRIGVGTRIVESSSGNTAIGLAQYCKTKASPRWRPSFSPTRTSKWWPASAAAVLPRIAGELEVARQRRLPRQAIAAAVSELFGRFDSDGPVGVSFPAVVVNGEVRTAGNLDKSWRRTDGAALFRQAIGRDCVLLNDADAAAIAEVRLGAGKGLAGKVIVVTIGTGLGSGIVHDGVLIPNFEFGRMPGHDGEPVEFFAGDRARKEADLGWKEWGKRFDYFLGRLVRVAAPHHLILGGGASKKFAKFRDVLTVDVPIRVAAFRNNAGIVGAALATSPQAAEAP